MRATTRRDFLVRSGQAALAAALFSQARSLAAQLTGDAAWRALIAHLEAQIPPLMTELLVPGVSLALISDGAIAWQRAFGVKDASTKQRVDTQTIFEAASMSKPVFAYAVLKQCEKKVLDLDTPLVTYGAPPFLDGDPRIKLITARHVLSHSTGLQNWRSDSQPLRIHFTPGTKYQYSGEGFAWLQSVVSHVTGQPIEPFMKANLLEPFGMTTSGYIWNETFGARAARPHDVKGQPEDNRKRTAADVARYAAAGDLEATPTEYAKFLLEMIAPKPPDEFRLTAASLKEMCRPHVKEPNPWGARGLGWQLVHTEKGEIIQHGGDNRGFHAFAVASIERRCGAVVMTNGENGATLIGRFLSDAVDRLRVASQH
ncbi:MAG: serine hydrolase [Acidobacteria bacterium]|nr:serine hydrolase [Acidobacteriota bacterium]